MQKEEFGARSEQNKDPVYRLRIIKEYEVCDGFELGQKVLFRIPLRGMGMPYLSSTKINVFNRFSVVYLLRVQIKLCKPVRDPLMMMED